METLLGSVQDNFALGSIINLFKGATGWRARALTVGNVLLILAAKHYLSKTEELIAPFRSAIGSLFQTLLYRQYQLPVTGPNELNHYLQKIVTSSGNSPYYSLGLPIYYKFSTDNSYFILELVRGAHDSYYQSLTEKAKLQLADYRNSKTKGTICKKFSPSFSATTYQPNQLFPSSNYLSLKETLVNYIRAITITKSYSPLGVLIDGEPGLGKTKSADFLATSNIFQEIIRIDMTLFLETSFEEILKKCYHDHIFSGPTLFVIDEMDKYLDYFTNKSYQKLIDIAQKNSKSDNKEPVVAAQPPNREAYYKQTKVDFLYAILRVLERDGLTTPCIILFCSNNFDSIFEGIDSVHFASLRTRFVRFTFHRCHRDELIAYLHHYNQLFVGTELHIEANKFSELCSRLNQEIELPYRSLHHISILAQYNLEKIIEGVNRWLPDHSPPHTPHVLINDTPLTLVTQITPSQPNPSNHPIKEDPEEESEEEEESDNDQSTAPKIVVAVAPPTVKSLEIIKKSYNPDLPLSFNRVSELVNSIDKTSDMNSKLALVCELFRCVSDSEFMDIMDRKPNLRQTIGGKIMALYKQHPMVETLIKPSIEIIRVRFPEMGIVSS